MTRTASLLALVLAICGAPAGAQLVAGGDFDVCDDCGNLRGGTAFVTGRAGFGTNDALFVLVNAAAAEQDVDHDGFTPGVNFNGLIVSDTTDFVNVANPSTVILRRNLVLRDFLNPLINGFSNQVAFRVSIPAGTPAGRYAGRFSIRDTLNGIGQNPNGEALRVDAVQVEIEVLAAHGIGVFQGDTAARADSLLIQGRPGQTRSAVVRVGNLGNAPLADVRLSTTDLVATSGTGLRIPAERLNFSPQSLTSVAVGDSARVVVSVRIPPGILAGEYRGDLIVQGADVPTVRIPIIVRVTTPGDIVFETNPVRGRAGDLAVIIFNSDPGTRWDMAIYDMMGLIAYRTGGTVFAGTGAGGQPQLGAACGGTGAAQFGGDEAVRTTWNLINGAGEPVAGGMYYVIVQTRQCGQRRQIRGKLMVIR